MNGFLEAVGTVGGLRMRKENQSVRTREQKRCEREDARTFSSCRFLPTLALMLYDEHDVAGKGRATKA